MVNSELAAYSEKLVQKPRVLALNKIDLVPEETVRNVVKGFKKKKIDILPISALEETGLQPPLERISHTLQEIKKSDEEESD